MTTAGAGRADVGASAPVHARGGIWLWAAGYFAAYVPYAFLTKALSDGRLGSAVSGIEILPLATLSSAIGMIALLVATGLVGRIERRTIAGASVPLPPPAVLLSGACTAAIVVTTTLAYAFAGAGIVLMMLLMRGGVLVIAPIVDRASRRRVAARSWIGLGLAALAIALAVGPIGGGVPPLAALDAAVYLAAYFVRLRVMSALAKREDRDASLRFFAGEQIVATPLAVLALALGALGSGPVAEELRSGFAMWAVPGAAPWIVLVGLCSQATGVFGALVLLDARENTFTVLVNRASSIVAGVLAALSLAVVLGGDAPRAGELAGAALLLAAMVVLALGERAPRSAAGDAAARGTE